MDVDAAISGRIASLFQFKQLLQVQFVFPFHVAHLPKQISPIRIGSIETTKVAFEYVKLILMRRNIHQFKCDVRSLVANNSTHTKKCQYKIWDI